MFPWVDGFHWTAVHIIFLTLFFTAVTIILSTFVSALLHTAGEFRAHRATEMWWRANFAEMPEEERRCRHELAGRVASRTCDNAFDCRHCVKYPEFAAIPANVHTQNVGVPYSDKLLYHRGHTWVRPEADGTVTIGLDEFAQHLIGTPDAATLPEFGNAIESNGIAWRMTKNGHQIIVRAPLDGTVVAIGEESDNWYLRIRSREPVNLRHLLSGAEVPGWLTKEIDRLQIQLSAGSGQPCLADGGTLMPNLMDAEPGADWDTILASTFLEG